MGILVEKLQVVPAMVKGIKVSWIVIPSCWLGLVRVITKRYTVCHDLVGIDQGMLHLSLNHSASLTTRI